MISINDKNLVFVLHGLFMHRAVMKKVCLALQGAGFIVENIDYKTTNINLDNLFDLINSKIKEHKAKYVHFVGHSLGGLMIRHFLLNNQIKNQGKVVTLGTPHKTAAIAKRVHELNLGIFIGNSGSHGLVDETLPETWKHHQKLGTISGTQSVGLLRILDSENAKKYPNDGTVYLEESKLEGQTDTIDIHVAHSVMITSDEVIRQTINFLKFGRFTKKTKRNKKK